jgi:hypothetical protein
VEGADLAFEVVDVLAFGELRPADVSDIVGVDVSAVDTVHAIVSSSDGLIEAHVKLACVRAGRGVQRRLCCPGCFRPAQILRAHNGVLRCARCQPHRTTAQLERTCRWWNREGGRMTDLLLRTARRRPGREQMQQLERLARKLVAEDERRLTAVMPMVRCALSLGRTS